MNAMLPRFRRRVSAGSGLLFAWLTTGVLPAADKSPAAPPVTHVLFMGAELSAENNRVYYPVVGVTAASIVIQADGKPVRLPVAQTADLRITDTLRLAEAKVELDQFKFERAFSADADPTNQLARTAALAAGQTAVVDLANAELRRANLMVAGASGAVAGAGSPEALADARRSLNAAQGVQAAAESNLNRAIDAPGSQIYDVGSQAGKLGAEERFDAIRVSFTITPDSDLAAPYCGVIAQLSDPDARRGQVRKWIYLQPIRPLLAGETQKVMVFQSGLPPGYTLVDCAVHVYDGGKEIATSLSRKRVALSREEALAYRVFEYIGENKGRTLPASLATTALALDAWATVPKAQLAATTYVRVGKDGRVTAAFSDADAKKPLRDPALVTVLKTLQFNPALEAGKPVESIAPVILGHLAVR